MGWIWDKPKKQQSPIELEMRTADGYLFLSVKGHNALDIHTMVANYCDFKKTIKVINKTQYTCFVATECMKLEIGLGYTIWFSVGDYVKIIL